MRVWVTRAEPGATRTAQALERLGHAPLVASVLEVRPIDADPPDLAGVAALAFTSRLGVEMFAVASGRRDLPVFAVGDATAEAARAAGFAAVASAKGDVAALAALIAAHRPALSGKVLHPCALEPAGDLAGALASRGIETVSAPIYRTVALLALPLEVDEALNACTLDAVLVHSPKAAQAMAGWLAAPARPGRTKDVRLLGLSPACIAPLAGVAFADRATAEAPNEAALLARLDP